MHSFDFSVLATLACFCSLFTGFNASKSEDCGSMGATDIKISITGCPDEMNPCVLHKGKNINLTIAFTATEAATQVTTVVHGIIAGIPIPFPVKQADACKYGNLTCPLVPKRQYHYHAIIPVLSAYPSIKLEVKWELRDKKDKKIICLEVPAELKSTATSRHRNNPHVDPNVMLFDKILFGV